MSDQWFSQIIELQSEHDLALAIADMHAALVEESSHSSTSGCSSFSGYLPMDPCGIVLRINISLNYVGRLSDGFNTLSSDDEPGSFGLDPHLNAFQARVYPRRSSRGPSSEASSHERPHTSHWVSSPFSLIRERSNPPTSIRGWLSDLEVVTDDSGECCDSDSTSSHEQSVTSAIPNLGCVVCSHCDEVCGHVRGNSHLSDINVTDDSWKSLYLLTVFSWTRFMSFGTSHNLTM
jgi:hypothetical protein